MRMLHYLLCFLFFCMHITYATEYMYPVACLNNGASILYIHQRTSEHIELFELNTLTHHTEQILWSVFNPAGLQLLPNNAGFSFIDNGRLRIKHFNKRSAKTIDCDEPIVNINSVQWIDEHVCYCSGQYNNNFAIFEIHTNGSMRFLITSNGNDCTYPQKINTQLFYIERYKENNHHDNFHYRIMQTNYPHAQDEIPLATTIVDFKDKPIIFLNMQSESEGFVVEHASYIDSNDTTSSFFYHHMVKIGEHWEKRLLFSFTIPTYLFLHRSKERLFESILPLLPRVIGNNIYFVSAREIGNLEPYCCDLSTMQCKKVIVPEQLGHYFVPIHCGESLCFGGTSIYFLT